MCEVVTARTDLTELEITSLACTGYVLWKANLIKRDVSKEVNTDRGKQRYVTIIQLDGRR